jgi:long-chain acyl-CoA synthetase
MFAPKYVENKLKFFPFIKEAVAFGDKREKVCAFINIDFEAVGNWAERRNLPYAGYTDLAQARGLRTDPRVRGEGQRRPGADALLAGSQISRFLVLHKELDADDGELTRTRKVRRGFIARSTRCWSTRCTAARPSSTSRPRSSSRTGAAAACRATLKIIDAKTFPAMKKAACGHDTRRRHGLASPQDRRRHPRRQEHLACASAA